jgi:RND family efflux transporter MFP subunit
MKNRAHSLLQFIRRKWLVVVIVLLLAGGAGFWWFRQANAQETYTTEAPQKRDLVETIDFSGIVDARERVGMRFSLGGKLVYLGAATGDRVQRGQTIASLDQRTVQKQLEKTLSQYESERWLFENAQDERKDQTLNTQERRLADLDQFSLERSVLDVQLQSLAFDTNRISAPFSGILVSSPYSVTGVNVGPTDTWELINPDTLYFRVLVDEIDIDAISVGQEAIIEIDAIPDRTFSAVVEKIAYTVSSGASGSVFPVDLRFTEPVSIEQHRVGMSGEARLILTEREQALSVPVEAITSREGKNFVQVLVDGKPQDREVTLGIETEDYVEITSGLNEQDQVVLP